MRSVQLGGRIFLKGKKSSKSTQDNLSENQNKKEYQLNRSE